MKNIIVCLFLCFSICVLHAQKNPVVTEEMEQFDKVSGNSLVVDIPEAVPSIVEKEWKSFLKVYGGKVKSSKKIISAERIRISSIGSDTIIIYSKFSPTANGIRLYAAFVDEGKFINKYEYPQKYEAAENLIYNFALRMAKEGVKEKTEIAEKDYKKKEMERDRLIRKQEQLQKSIERSKENIRKAEKDLEKNNKELEEKNIELKLEEQKLEEIEKKNKVIHKMD